MLEVVAERGYPETRVLDVIKRAGVSRRTFYGLFDDKEACFLAAYDMALGRLYRGTEIGFDSAPEAAWADRIRAGLAAFLRIMAEHPAAAKVCVLDVRAAGPRALARRDAALRRFTAFIDAGRAETRRELPGITALSLAGGINELLHSEILKGAGDELPSRLPEIIYWITQPFLGSERALAERERARPMSADRQPAEVRVGERRGGSS